MDQSLSVTQTQKLETSLIQFVDMLTMPTAELNEKIKEEAERNPVLEIRENTSSVESLSVKRKHDSPSPGGDEANPASFSDDEDSSDWFERTVSGKEDLKEHLMKELGCLELPQDVRECAEAVISGLDSYGFTGPDPSLLVPDRDQSVLSEAIKAVQSLEPTGVGAADWKEALMLQIREMEKDKSERRRYRDIIYKGLDYIRKGEEDRLARALGIGREDLDAMIRVIKSLTPFPGLKYSSDYTSYATPEIEITRKNGILVLRMLSPLLSVSIDSEYLSLIEEIRKKKDRDAGKFLRENMTRAENLMNLLERRKSTLEKLGILLMEKQKDFFLSGPVFLKALTMTDAAGILGLSIGTVSKLAQEKYILTDWGTYPLRFFFSTEVKSSADENVSKTAVMFRIREILEENGTKKLSDQKIAEMLEENGIHIARRTVNKYRKALGN